MCLNYIEKVFSEKKISNNIKISNFVINSKEVKKGSVFFAIKGKKTDGHFYVKDAIKKGCSICVVKKKFKAPSMNQENLIKVSSPLKFLEKIAKENRNRSKNIFIGITGSFGKTTLKSMLQFFLEKYKKTYSSPKSFNNHFGLPLSLSNTPRNSLFNIFELGMSKKGEIDKLAKILRPDIGVITNIGPAHIGNFKNLKQICLAKAELIKHIKDGGTIFLNRDDKFFEILQKIAKKQKLKVISFGTSGKSNIRLIKIIKQNNKKYLLIKIQQKKIKIETLTLNDNFNKNFLIVIAILIHFKLNLKRIIKIAKNFPIPTGRGDFLYIKIKNKKIEIINDSYNANPVSMINAIKNFVTLNTKKEKVVIIGDMLELGCKSRFYHQKVGNYLNNTKIKRVYLVGKEVECIYTKLKSIKNCEIYKNIDQFKEVFREILNEKSIFLIKGSNSIGLNKLLNESF
jgi:UDP-N-acetylmuramoyl-tripeptide--D-alanyl-D-alanine ligase